MRIFFSYVWDMRIFFLICRHMRFHEKIGFSLPDWHFCFFAVMDANTKTVFYISWMSRLMELWLIFNCWFGHIGNSNTLGVQHVRCFPKFIVSSPAQGLRLCWALQTFMDCKFNQAHSIPNAIPFWYYTHILMCPIRMVSTKWAISWGCPWKTKRPVLLQDYIFNFSIACPQSSWWRNCIFSVRICPNRMAKHWA
jgi:hypothetical protein